MPELTYLSFFTNIFLETVTYFYFLQSQFSELNDPRCNEVPEIKYASVWAIISNNVSKKSL